MRRRTDYPFMNEITEEWQERIRNGECNAHTKVEFICQARLGHPNYIQSLNGHMVGKGCSICANNLIKTDYPFMEEITPYWQGKIMNGECTSLTKVEFICMNLDENHPNYIQRLGVHSRNGMGCPICGNKKISIIKSRKNYPFMDEITKEWQEKIRNGECHSQTKVDFICEKHGIYSQSLSNHMYQGSNCPICKESKGEKAVRMFLSNHNIDYVFQKTFDDCKYKYILRFDFYIPSKNLLIEYQGIQHYEERSQFGGKNNYKIQVEKDNIKRQYCKNNNIKLIEIPYWELNNVENILLKEVG